MKGWQEYINQAVKRVLPHNCHSTAFASTLIAGVLPNTDTDIMHGTIIADCVDC